MSGKSTRLVVVAAAAAVASLALTSGTVRAADEPTTRELLEYIQQLQAKVEQLEAKQQQPPQSSTAPPSSSQPSNTDVAETVQQIVRDAEKRSAFNLLQAPEANVTALAGHEKGKFFIRSDDGDFLINPFLQFQFRHVTTYADALIDGGVDTGSEFESGFELRRMKFGAEGHIFEKFEYKFVWAYTRATGDIFLEDAIVSYDLNDTWSIFGGQFKDPVHHEELVSSTRQLAADRSLVNELLGGGAVDRVQGVGVVYAADPIKVTGALHDGQASMNTNFRDTPVNESDWGVAGRVEYLVAGNWKAYQDFTAIGNKQSVFVIGAGADISGLEGANGLAYTLDGQWENAQGLSVYGAFLGYYTDPYGDGDAANDFGALAQVAQMLGNKTEVFGRVGWINFDADAADQDSILELTVGGNYYIHGHNAKFTADVTYLPDGAPSESGLGIVNSGDEDQIVARLQFQLVL